METDRGDRAQGRKDRRKRAGQLLDNMGFGETPNEPNGPSFEPQKETEYAEIPTEPQDFGRDMGLINLPSVNERRDTWKDLADMGDLIAPSLPKQMKSTPGGPKLTVNG